MANFGAKTGARSMGGGSGSNGSSIGDNRSGGAAVGTVTLKGDASKLVDSQNSAAAALQNTTTKLQQQAAELAAAVAQQQKLDAATAASAAAAKKYALQLEINRARVENGAASQAKFADTQARVTASSSRLAPALGKVNAAAQAVTGSSLGMSRSLANMASAFGPWGLAISIGANALLSYSESEDAAAAATKRATAAINEQRRAAQGAAADAALARFKGDVDGRRRGQVRGTLGGAARDEEMLATEQLIARQAAAGEKTFALEQNLRRLQIEDLASKQAEAAVGVNLADIDARRSYEAEVQTLELEKQAKAREASIADAAELGRTEAKNHGARKAANDESYKLAKHAYQLELARAAARQRLFDDLHEMEANNERDREAFFAGEDLRFEAAIQRTEQLQQARFAAQIDRQRAQGDAAGIKDPILAQLEAERIESQFEHATEAEFFDVQAEQNRQLRHEAEMQRIGEEVRAREEQLAAITKYSAAAGQAAGQVVIGLLTISDARRQAKNAALAQGKSEAEAAKAGRIAELQTRASQLQGIRNMAAVRAIEQTAMGIAALASFNYVGAALHFGAAATFGVLAGAAGIRSNTLAGQATALEGNGQGGAGGFGVQGGAGGRGSSGGGSGGGGGSSANTGPIPGSPTPQPRSGSTPRGGTVINISGNFYGTPRRDFIRMVTEGQDAERNNGRGPRRTGND